MSTEQPNQPNQPVPPTTPPTPPAAAPKSANSIESKGFFKALLDLSFTSFITLRFTQFIYVIILVVIALMLLGWLITWIVLFATGHAGWAILSLLFGWIIPVLNLIFGRITLEFFISQIRTAQNTGAAREELEKLNARHA